jgi:hypothetical protein
MSLDSTLHILHFDYFLYGYLKNIDNKKLSKICKDNYNNRLSKNVAEGRNEDLKIPYTKEIEIISNYLITAYKEKFNKNLKMVEYWSQVHFFNESTMMHNHLDPTNRDDLSADVAGVYYVDIPKDSGDLTLEYYIHRFKVEHWTFPPETNKFIMFPAGIDHRVSKNLNKKPRIALAFNFKHI